MPLEITRRKNSKNWYIRGTVRGVTINQTTGTHEREIAESIRVKKEHELLEQSVFGKSATVTFGNAVLSYLENGGSPRFIGEVLENGATTLLLGEFYNSKLRDIRQSDLAQAARRLYPTATPETLNRNCYTPFIAVWNHAVKNEWAEPKKWQRPRRKKGTLIARPISRSGTNPVSYDKAAKFVAAMIPAPAMVMTALFFTGMRPIELFTLTGADIDVDNRWIALNGSKTGEPRGVPMHEFLAPIFASLVQNQGAVFRSSQGKPYVVTGLSGGQIKTAINSARRRTGVTNISPYTARHTVSTQLVIEGVHAHTKDQILGHVATEMSRVYTRVPRLDLIDAINKIKVPAAWKKLWWLADPAKAVLVKSVQNPCIEK